MSLRHTNPTVARRDRNGRTFWARAPYNFVPLPDVVVPAPGGLPGHDEYGEGMLTGHITCELETCSPVYIRGALSPDDFRELGEKGPDGLKVEEKERRAHFFGMGDGEVDGRPRPAIPGTSLRGMLRSLVEIASFGGMRWVGKEPTFTFRAVAASRDDPLREPYRNVIGAFGRNVRVGYLVRRGDDWYVQPALTPKQMGWSSDDAFVKVKARTISGHDLPGYIPLDDPNYRPQIHPVRFAAEVRRSERGSFVLVTGLEARKKSQLPFEGMLVCSGNMKESSKDKADRPSPRRSHALVLLPDAKARTLRIPEQAIRDYLAGLTPYQREMLKDWSGDRCAEMGCLGELKPVFYVAEGNQVLFFGHSPNFRIPARLAGTARAATPPDFVPGPLRECRDPDLSQAIFGWVEEPGGLKAQRAGRVSVGDARLIAPDHDIWLQPEPIIPHTLAAPKATTFQHYLVHDRAAGHDPDRKEMLAHYGSTQSSTQLRGFKQYWHRGRTPDIEATATERAHENQVTRIVPLKTGVCFEFRLDFENLRPEELGALWWALALPGEPGKTYRHKLGMGKPLGMGAVALRPRLYVDERRGEAGRYGKVFGPAGWAVMEQEADGAAYAARFEAYVLQAAGLPGAKRLADVERIRMLLAMLEWHESTEEWLTATSYMQVEAGADGVNEYKERPVLPDPLAVLAQQAAGMTPGRQADQPTRPAPRPAETARGGTPIGGGQPPAKPPVEAMTKPATEMPPGLVGAAGPEKAADSGTRTGTVSVWNADRSYGFIRPDTGNERGIFFHISAVKGKTPLLVGGRVQFEMGEGPKGPQAINVRPLL